MTHSAIGPGTPTHRPLFNGGLRVANFECRWLRLTTEERDRAMALVPDHHVFVQQVLCAGYPVSGAGVTYAAGRWWGSRLRGIDAAWDYASQVAPLLSLTNRHGGRAIWSLELIRRAMTRRVTSDGQALAAHFSPERITAELTWQQDSTRCEHLLTLLLACSVPHDATKSPTKLILRALAAGPTPVARVQLLRRLADVSVAA